MASTAASSPARPAPVRHRPAGRAFEAGHFGHQLIGVGVLGARVAVATAVAGGGVVFFQLGQRG
ncbi:MAG: hypothetical protein WKG07_07550 [Hymenobacter sp.]